MGFDFLSQVAKFLQERKEYRRWLAAFLCLALVVAFGTVAALKLYGQAMTHQEKVLDCQYEVHEHTEDCYEENEDGEKVLACGMADYVIHVHNDDCYNQKGELVCPLEEHEVHEHDDSCYEEEEVLICKEEEAEESSEDVEEEEAAGEEPETAAQPADDSEETEAAAQPADDSKDTEDSGSKAETRKELACKVEEHTHDDSCYKTTETMVCKETEHTHDDSCYSEGEPVLECGETEHTHGDDCYDDEGNLICKEEEHEHDDSCYSEGEAVLDCEEKEHTHDDDCYEVTETLDCGKEEHRHDDSCYKEVIEEKDDSEAQEEVKAETKETTAPEPAAESKSGEAAKDGEEAEEGHTHTDDCYETEEVLTCGELELHTHDADLESDTCCYTSDCFDKDGNLIEGSRPFCGLLQLEEHVHTEECFKNAELTAEEIAELNGIKYYCGKAAHKHDQSCYDEKGGLICGKEEHEHDDSCLIPPEIRLEAEAGDYLIVLETTEEAFPNMEEELTLEAVLLPEDSEEYQLTKELVEESREPGETGAAMELPFEIQVDGEDATELLIESMKTGDIAEDEENSAKEQNLFLTEEEGGAHDIFDICVTAGGEEIQPEVPVKVSFIRKDIDSEQAVEKGEDESKGTGENVQVFHVDTENETVEDMEAEEDENGNLVISTPHFSTYDVTMDGTPSAQDRSGWEGLSEYIYGGGTHGKTITIRLTEDIVVGTNAAGDALKPVFVDCGRKITLDLNGHKISYGSKKVFLSGYETGELFIVGGNGDRSSLTIRDSAAGFVTSGSESVTLGATYESSYDRENRVLTYYKTTSTGVGADSSALSDVSKAVKTTETTTKYTVNFSSAGVIENSSVQDAQALIKVMTGGTLTIEGGVLTNEYGRVVRTNPFVADKGDQNDHDMEISLTGGYLVGSGRTDANGGAVDFEGSGTLNIGRDVLIAANRAAEGGGIYTKGLNNSTSITVNLDGGSVCGNQAGSTGGGLRLQDTTTYLNKCFVTNNRAGGEGGGIRLAWTDFYMNGGLVAANNSESGGGGICFNAEAQDSKQARLKGGAVSANESNVEGGGIRVNTGYVEIIAEDGKLFYITNNKGNKNGSDWGGGGIFISDNSGRVKIYRTLITKNQAGGFGGGLGGCSTGRIISLDVANGASVYGNTALGTNLSGTASSKHQDHDAANNPVFMEGHNFQDVFSALGCYISQGMLSDDPYNRDVVYPANWKGSCDYEPVPEYDLVTKEPGQVVSTRMLGLSAAPDENSKAVTQKIANVFITGNDSTTHGGGIMCNGLLLLGESHNVTYDESLTLELRKAYKSDEGADLSLNQGNFQFRLLDSNGNVITTVSNTSENHPANTNVQILLKYRYDNVQYGEGKDCAEYVYYLKEVIPNDPGMIEYDPAEYRIKVRVKTGHDTYMVGNSVEISRYWVYIDDSEDSVIVEKKQTDENGAKSWVRVETDQRDGFGNHGASTSHHGASIVLGGKTDAAPDGSSVSVRDPLFTNISRTPQLTFWIRKTDSLTNKIMQHVGFTLTRLDSDGKKLRGSSLPGSAEHPLVGNTDFGGEFSYTIPDVENRSYILEEAVPPGYEQAGPWYVETDGKGNVSVWPAKEEAGGRYKKDGKELSKEDKTENGIVYALIPIENVPIRYELPETGGHGTIAYTTAGVLLIMLGAGFLYKKKFSERRV